MNFIIGNSYRRSCLTSLFWMAILAIGLPVNHLNAGTVAWQEGDTLLALKYIATAKRLKESKTYDSAITYYQKAAFEYQRAKKWDAFFGSHNKVGHTLSLQFKFKDSFNYLDSIEQQFYDHLRKGMSSYQWLYRGLAWAQFKLINYEEAIDYLDKIKLGVDANPDTIDSNTIFELYYRGVIYQRIGQYDLALKQMLASRDFSLRVGAKGTASNTYNNLGVIYRNLGEYERALEYYKKALALGKEQWPEINLTPLNNNIGTLYFYLKDYEAALKELNYGLKVLTSYTKEYFPIESALTNSKARVLIEQFDLDSAELILNNVLAREREQYGTTGIRSIETLLSLSKLYASKEDYSTSITYADQAIEIYRANIELKNDKVAAFYNQKGTALFNSKRYLDAVNSHQQSLISLVSEFNSSDFQANPLTTASVPNKEELVKSLYLKSKALMELFRTTNKKQYLEAATAANLAAQQFVGLIRKSMLYESSVVRFSEKAKDVFEQGIELSLVRDNNKNQMLAEAVFSAMENSKSYLLAESILKAKNLGYSNASRIYLSKEDSFRTKIKLLETKRHNNLVRIKDSTKLAETDRQLFLAKETFEDFVQSNSSKSERIASLTYGTISKLSTIQHNIPHGELLIEYFAGSKNLYAIAVNKVKVEVFQLGEYQEKVEDFAATLQKVSALNASDYQTKADEIYQLILAPIIEDFGTAKSLIIIPDKQLGYLPFDALVSSCTTAPEYNSLNYLINEYTISQHQSLSLYMAENNENAVSDNGYIGYAPNFNDNQLTKLLIASRGDKNSRSVLQPLPFAKKEVTSISELLNGKTVTDNLASEENFKASANSFNILHIATHAIIDEENPIYSRLIFAPTDSSSLEDGFLYSFEIYGLNIVSDLVTLSACNTGSGKYFAGEGIFSLGRSFLMAGAKSVVTSLWEVSDLSTSQIMERFYNELKDGETKPEALRQAKLDYLKNADPLTANPHYWAAFIYIGQSDAIYSSNRIYYWSGGFLFVIIVIGTLRKRIL